MATAFPTASGSIWDCRPARGPDGKMYKPLFAILCTDLDGRLNLNAHGSLPQTLGNYYSSERARGDGDESRLPQLYAGGSGGTTVAGDPARAGFRPGGDQSQSAFRHQHA